MIRLFSEAPDIKVTEKLLYKVIHQHGPITKNGALQYVQSSSLATISRFIDNLEKNGLILINNRETAGGRNPAEYVINPGACYSFGAYIGCDAYGIGLCDISGNIIEKTIRLFEHNTTPAEVINFFGEFIHHVIDQNQVDPAKMPGLGISVAGPILKEKGMIFHPHHLTIPGWEIVSIKDLVEMKTGYTTWVDSIAETALLGELIYGPHKGQTNAAYLWIDKGIGSAIYSRGELGIGSEDFSSSVGHTVIDFKGKPCICGKRGCLETYASIESMIVGIQAIEPDIKSDRIANISDCAEEIWNCSPELQMIEDYQYVDDPEIRAYFEELIEAFAAAISNFLYLTRPKALFLAGRTTEQLPSVIERVIEKLQKEYDQNLVKDLRFIKSHLNDELLIKGASFLVFNNYIQYF